VTWIDGPSPAAGRSSAPASCTGTITFRLASSRGYCYGVDRALRIVREAIDGFRGRRIFITSPILHNPQINRELAAAGVIFLSDGAGRWEEIRPGDVVILPAFGVAPQLRNLLEEKGVLLVDTTCGSVVYVWKNIDRFVRDGFTVVYHGRRGHEEAEASLARLHAGGRCHPYAAVERFEEAEAIALYLEGRIGALELTARLECGLSREFAPERDLVRIGFANQTTMLARESLAIARRLEEALAVRFPDEPLADHFRLQETICPATEERQRAVEELLAAGIDLLLAIGGFDSSNTTHLAELARAAGIPAYHVAEADDILSRRTIRHKSPASRRPLETEGWLPEGEVVIGVTSGASTPEDAVRRVLSRVEEVARGDSDGLAAAGGNNGGFKPCSSSRTGIP
jgi:4-hydroxy-3-methylbut-2-enyl diphosphate reductase